MKKKTNPRWDRFLFSEALEFLNELEDPLIIEIGGIRDPRPIAARADGHSTMHWAKSKCRTFCIDLDQKTIDTTKRLIGEDHHVKLVKADGLAFLKNVKEPINLLYLDGPDPKDRGSEFALACFKAAPLDQQSVILVDDCDISPGKGDLVIPAAVKSGFMLVRKDRQALLVKGFSSKAY